MSGGRDVLEPTADDGRTELDDGRGMTPGGKPILPLWLRSGVLAMLLVAFVYALFGTKDDSPLVTDRGDVIASRELRFEDEADGTITVRDAVNGDALERLAVGEDGFVRSVMRGLVRERRARGLGPDTPFRLTTWSSGFVSLEDPATGRTIELTAFGPDNVAAFARLVAERG